MIKVTGKIVLLPEPVKRYPRTNELCYDKTRKCLFRAPILFVGDTTIMNISLDTIVETEIKPPTSEEKFSKARELLERSIAGDPTVDQEIVDFLANTVVEDDEE